MNDFAAIGLRIQGEYVRDGTKCQPLRIICSTQLPVQRLIVQIYEVQTPAEAEYLIDLDVDHIGSVILSQDNWQQSILKETIETIRSSTAKSSLIPLYHHPETVLQTLDYYQPDIVHFCEALVGHARLWDFCNQLIQLQTAVKNQFPQIKVMRSIPIAQSGDADEVPTLEFAKRFEPASDYFLTDTFLAKAAGSDQNSQPVQGYVGITGKTCNWKIARKLVEVSRVPVILAGGISPQNAVDGIQQVNPAGVDSCTQTNALDEKGQPIRFKKDLAKVKQLVKNVRQTERALSHRSDDTA
jgi:phosphoribosylanthranilate isomerase